MDFGRLPKHSEKTGYYMATRTEAGAERSQENPAMGLKRGHDVGCFGARAFVRL